METPAINIDKLSKIYNEKNIILKDISQGFYPSKFYAVTGESGVGKSTLLQIIGLLDKPTSGSVIIKQYNTKDLSDTKKACLRRDSIGFIFQSFLLNPQLNALQNVMLPMFIVRGLSNKEMHSRAMSILDELGISNRASYYPNTLSGGEQQRVAIARALVNNPDIILADEPTGNLDEKNENVVFSILQSLTKKNKCVIVVSHNPVIVTYADVILSLENGSLRCLANEVKV